MLNRIVEWNKERGLDQQEVDISNEVSFIVEELIEMTTQMKSEEARNYAQIVTNNMFSVDIMPSNEQVADAAADIIVFATGLILKSGFNPEIVMDEVLKEIESRVGSEDETGKWVKDRSPEAQAKWYKANFNKAKLIKI